MCISWLVTDDTTSWRSSKAQAGYNPEAAGWTGSERPRDRWFSLWESFHTDVHTDACMRQSSVRECASETHEQHSVIHSFTRDIRAGNTHLAKSTHFSMIFLGDSRLQMIPTKSGWNERQDFRKGIYRGGIGRCRFKPRTLSSCRARWCVANIRIPRREQSVESRKLRRTASSCGGDTRKMDFYP